MPGEPHVVVTDHHASVVDVVSRRFPDVLFLSPSSASTVGDDASVALWIAGGGAGEHVGWQGWTDRAEWIHFTSSGLDRHDLPSFGGAVLTNSRFATSEAIAEFAVGALLSAAKDFPSTWGLGASTRPDARSLGTLKGAVVGLLGLGAIGQAVAARLQGFGADVVAVRRRPLPSSPGVRLLSDVRALAAESDHLVLTAPLTDETRGIVGPAVFARAKRGIHLVNVSRGGLVDHDALVAALRDGVVARATLDVTEPEPLPDDHPLRADHRVFLSPHLSASSSQSSQRVVRIFLENLARWLDGRELLNVVDPIAGY